MILREATVTEAAALAKVHGAAFEAPWNASDIAVMLKGAGAFAFAVQAPRRLAGFILCRTLADQSEILTLATHPRHRRLGVAKSLAACACAAARARGAATMFLEVAADNAAAIALYMGEGFERAGERRGYYARPGGPAVDAWVLRLALNR